MAHKMMPEEAAVEGGLINDRSGKASAQLRRRGYRLPMSKPKMRRGNPAMRRFPK